MHVQILWEHTTVKTLRKQGQGGSKSLPGQEVWAPEQPTMNAATFVSNRRAKLQDATDQTIHIRGISDATVNRNQKVAVTYTSGFIRKPQQQIDRCPMLVF